MGTGDDDSQHATSSSLGEASAFLREAARAPSVPVAEDEDLSGRTLAHFKLRGVLGRGGMGVVYEAEDTKLKRNVAVKVLGEGRDNAEARRRIAREARLAAAVSHPNVATVYEVLEIEGRVLYAMERVSGESLSERIARGPLPPEEVARIAREIALALAKAHEAGIVHRDIKPANVMLAEDGGVKVLDFGLARTHLRSVPNGTSDTEIRTEDGRILGTVVYMSPEQAKGHRVDARSDIFSLGTTIYEALSGRRPFDRETTVETLIAIDRDDPPPLRARPDDLVRLVRRCLAKRPDDRPSADEVARSLATIRPGSRRRPWIGIAALAAIAIASGVALKRRSTAAIQPMPVAAASRDPLEIPGWGPIPPSPNREALVAYAAGMNAMRSGSNSAFVHFEKALKIDPELSAANLRLAVFYAFFAGAHERARTHLQSAQRGRARLAEIDVVLLAALEPLLLRDPMDRDEAVRRFEAATARFKGSIELRSLYGLMTIEAGEPNILQRTYDHWTALATEDPGYGRAWAIVSQTEAYFGKPDAAKRAMDNCFKHAPNTTACLVERSIQNGEAGRCAEYLADAKQMVVSDPDDVMPYMFLANGLAANDAPLDSVREALAQARRREPEWNPATVNNAPDLLADLWNGDLETVIASARKLQAEVAPSTSVDTRWPPTYFEMIALEEIGKTNEAANVAQSFLTKMSAWQGSTRPDDFGMASDPLPESWRVMRNAGHLSHANLVKERTAWLERMKANQHDELMRRYSWFHAYAKFGETEALAKEALLALPAFEPLPPYRPLSTVEMAVGRTYVLAGQPQAAIPWLEQVTRKCIPLPTTVDQMRGFYWLGRARQATGDRDGACTAYASLMKRWGNARPRSVTVDNARKEMASLGCRP